MNLLLNFLYAYLPQPPISTAVSLCCPADDDDNNADRVSHLPDDLLRRVVSLLPAKDGARTTALSSRWRHLWRSTPLLLVDTHLLPGGDAELRPARAGAASRAVTNAVSAALESHPGPFPFASLTCSFMDLTVTDRRQLARWFQLLATKGARRRARLPQPPLARPRPAPPSRNLQLRLPPPALHRRLGVSGHRHRPARRGLPQPSRGPPRLHHHPGQGPGVRACREPRAGDARGRRKPDPAARSSRQPQPEVRAVLLVHPRGSRRAGCPQPGEALPLEKF
ncbi:hypothetical protein QYE76_021086 [Lolium multiflorum]|uniref:F-box domain-containing protein n=1 Tax=Lolium multiflorum TaxID=4521 RepID=A0AAD8R9Y0_LOLMU|nr:hypothetical protein QYE76_021086 [Lolium multiflorum]